MGCDDKTTETLDLLVVGGGINGTGIARDAAGRGLSVLLCEQDDLAHYASSSSTKLIHGGLRYLEHYDFKLVRHSLGEREVLLRSAPHIIWPLRFILPHHHALRPRWLIRLGLFLYDHLGKRKILPASHGIDLTKHTSGKALKSEFSYGFEYSDCWVQDSRMTVLNAVDARAKGAAIRTRTRCVRLEKTAGYWRVALLDRERNEHYQIQARAVVNASGPWVEQVAGLGLRNRSAHKVRLVKGSHIVVPALFDHDYAYIFQNSDNRVMFAIPYEGKFTLLGTTEEEISSDPGQASVSDTEIQYICDNVNQYFSKPVSPRDVVYSYSGVRPLFNDAAANASETSRDYVLHISKDGPPIVSVYGGKLTTYRVLSEQVVNMLAAPLGFNADPWTAVSVLPGGNIPGLDYEHFVSVCKQRYQWCDPGVIEHLARNYGTKIDTILEQADAAGELGLHFGWNLYEPEVKYLVNMEWAVTVEDIIWRRTKAGLHGGEELAQNLARWLETYQKQSRIPVVRH
jgi:glycerol-3-phosphate dehydrogenase